MHQLWRDDSELARTLHPKGLFLVCSQGLEGSPLPLLPIANKLFALLLKHHLLGGAFPASVVEGCRHPHVALPSLPMLCWAWPVTPRTPRGSGRLAGREGMLPY